MIRKVHSNHPARRGGRFHILSVYRRRDGSLLFDDTKTSKQYGRCYDMHPCSRIQRKQRHSNLYLIRRFFSSGWSIAVLLPFLMFEQGAPIPVAIQSSLFCCFSPLFHRIDRIGNILDPRMTANIYPFWMSTWILDRNKKSELKRTVRIRRVQVLILKIILWWHPWLKEESINCDRTQNPKEESIVTKHKIQRKNQSWPNTKPAIFPCFMEIDIRSWQPVPQIIDIEDKPRPVFETTKQEMMRHYNLFTAFLLSLLAISSSFLPPAILAVVGLLDSFVDSFTLVVTPGPSRQKIQVPKRRLLSSKSSRTRKTDEFIDDENSNASTTKSETESTASNTTRNKKEATTTKDYQRIEEWNKKTHDSNHVIGQLKHENAKWRKTFGNLEKLEK